MGLLDGKVAVITGAGGGLGQAYALLFAQEGCKVVVNDLGGSRDGSGGDGAMADQVVAEIKEAGGEAIANYASVSDIDGAQSMIDDAVNTWGRLDVVVNNAGILRDKTLLKLDPENFDIVLNVHARGTYLVGKAGAAAMKTLGNGGSIINTSSIAGLKGNFGQTNYACAKAGIAGMTRVWSQELVRAGIRTNAIAPMAKTRMTEEIDAVPDDVTPEQIAPVALFLASDLSSDVNGRIFGAHGPHVFEYHMMLSPGLDLGTETWTATGIAERLDEISKLPSAESDSGGEAGFDVQGALDEIFGRMPEFFIGERAGEWTASIHFDITGSGSYTIGIADGNCTSTPGAPDSATCTITYDSAQTMLDVVAGELNPQQAFMNGQIKADNMADLMKFAQCFDMKKGMELAKARAGAGAGPSDEDQINEVFNRMPGFFVPDRAGSWESTLYFNVKGTGSWTVSVAGGECNSAKGKPDSPSCTINYESATVFLDTISGKTNSQQAFMAGKISADNMGDLMKFAQCFDMKRAASEMKSTDKGAASAAPATEGMNPAAIGTTFRTGCEFIKPEDARAYAEATNDLNPAYVNGSDVIVPLIYPVRPTLAPIADAVTNKELNADLLRLVHGEQEMIFHDVLKPMDLVAARATLLDIEKKSSGELLKVRQRLMRDGEVVCEIISGYFIRAKIKGEKKAAKPPEATAPVDLILDSTFTVDDDQSYRYAEASMDRNPIHVSEQTAKAAGHPGVICHGLCTMAMSTRELVNGLAGSDPRRIKRVKLRFSRIVLPGETLTVRAWDVERNENIRTIGFETVNQDGKKVISNALIDIAD